MISTTKSRTMIDAVFNGIYTDTHLVFPNNLTLLPYLPLLQVNLSIVHETEYN